MNRYKIIYKDGSQCTIYADEWTLNRQEKEVIFRKNPDNSTSLIISIFNWNNIAGFVVTDKAKGGDDE